jgi:hypothetical protein
MNVFRHFGGGTNPELDFILERQNRAPGISKRGIMKRHGAAARLPQSGTQSKLKGIEVNTKRTYP